jgi:hypothetical protein
MERLAAESDFMKIGKQLSAWAEKTFGAEVEAACAASQGRIRIIVRGWAVWNVDVGLVRLEGQRLTEAERHAMVGSASKEVSLLTVPVVARRQAQRLTQPVRTCFEARIPPFLKILPALWDEVELTSRDGSVRQPPLDDWRTVRRIGGSIGGMGETSEAESRRQSRSRITRRPYVVPK